MGLLRAEVRVRAMLSSALQARTGTRCAAGNPNPDPDPNPDPNPNPNPNPDPDPT